MRVKICGEEFRGKSDRVRSRDGHRVGSENIAGTRQISQELQTPQVMELLVVIVVGAVVLVGVPANADARQPWAAHSHKR